MSAQLHHKKELSRLAGLFLVLLKSPAARLDFFVFPPLTKYAKKILEIVEQSRSHMTAEQIFMELRRTYPTVVLATVYNNLNRLWQDDLIRKVSVEGTPDRYDRIQRHDHLVCKECGKLLDVDLGDLTAQLEQKAGTAILSYDLKLVYLCDECRKKKGM